MSNIPKQLNRQSPLALYYQLKHILLAQIDSGEYKDGDRLPSEYELTNQYKVSRHVARQALKDLITEGRIIARKGTGYFVNSKRYRKALPKLGSHTISMEKLELPTRTIVTSQEIVTPPDFIAEKLLSSRENKAIFIERVSYLEGEPVCMIRAYYPLKYSSVLYDVDLNNKSIYTLLQNRFSIVPKRAETIISVVFAEDSQSNLLNIREGVPLLHLGSFTWAENDELFEYSSGYYRIDRFELEIEQT